METVSEICSLRGYSLERMSGVLVRAQFNWVVRDKLDIVKLSKYGDDLGLISSNGSFLLTDRYIFPVLDMLGNVIALIGWYPDEKKYVTTPSKLFSKEGLFYGMEQLGVTGIGCKYYVVEGIFDCLSVRSLGLNCVAQMGITSSRYKEVLYTLFSRVVAVPDNDEQGIDVLKNDKWRIPRNGKYFRWKCPSYYMKDIDSLCNRYEREDIKNLLLEVYEQPERVVTVEL